jgi:hypothetical protein
MSRSRGLVLFVLIAVFAVTGGILVYVSQSHGGQARTINVTVTGARSMSPETLTANFDDTLTVNITSDITGEVHLHGYDIQFSCVAGQVTTRTFKADKSGRFPIEWESTGTPLGALAVT